MYEVSSAPELEFTMARGGNIGGICDKGTEIQSVLFNKDRYTEAQAKNWAHKHGFKYGKVDTTENYHRLRQQDPSDFKQDGFRTITLKNNIKAVIGCPIEKKATGGGLKNIYEVQILHDGESPESLEVFDTYEEAEKFKKDNQPLYKEDLDIETLTIPT
jgi:hypothetical protein